MKFQKQTKNGVSERKALSQAQINNFIADLDNSDISDDYTDSSDGKWISKLCLVLLYIFKTFEVVFFQNLDSEDSCSDISEQEENNQSVFSMSNFLEKWIFYENSFIHTVSIFMWECLTQ